MGLLETLKAWFRSERDEARDLVQELEQDWASDLDRREAELEAEPDQRVRNLQDLIAENSAAFEELKAKITRTGPVPDDTEEPPAEGRRP